MAVCVVTGLLTQLDGTVLAGQQIVATIELTDDDQGGQVLDLAGVSSDGIEAFTELDGTFSIELLQGAIVLLEIPAINLRKRVVVPAVDTVDFVALI